MFSFTNRINILLLVVGLFVNLYPSSFAIASESHPARILVVDSYHKEYEWSKETNRGFLEAFKQKGLISTSQIKSYDETNEVNGKRIILRRIWLDTKRDKNPSAKYDNLNKVMSFVDDFKPDIIFLGDDNAVDLIGYAYLDYDIPIIFWGVNGIPDRYDFFDSLQIPGHNISGVYQSMYQLESAKLLQKLLPEIKAMTIVGDDSKTSRARLAQIKSYIKSSKWPFEITDIYLSNNFNAWKKDIKDLSRETDSFFILNVSAMKDGEGNHISEDDVINWYLDNIDKPEASALDSYVSKGLLCNVEDSGFNQGFDAATRGIDILFSDADISKLPVSTPFPGDRLLNSERADSFNIIKPNSNIDREVSRERMHEK